MDITIFPRKLKGTVKAIPSKSQAHRILICAAFADRDTYMICPDTNQDIEATAGCLQSLGADILRTSDGYQVSPIQTLPKSATLDCKESGSTLRFLLPVCAAVGVDTTFLMSGRLPFRPLSPLWEELERMGCKLSRPTENTIRCHGQLHSGSYSIDGSVSSQFITGLLFALALLPGENSLTITGNLESKPYVDLTLQVLSMFGKEFDGTRFIKESSLISPGQVTVEGDWSNGAFFLAAKAMGNEVEITGLSDQSKQGDRAAKQILNDLSQHITIYGNDIPDLVPILAITAGAKKGATFEQIGRLRLKESDRVAAVAEMLSALGAAVQVSGDRMTVFPANYQGCMIDSKNDHRIAMSAAIASTVASGPVTILNAQCVSKSYPHFWSEFTRLGGYYEQYIRK